MGILTRLIDSLAPEVVVEVREVRRPRKRPPSSAGNDYAKRFAIERRLSDRQIHELIGLCRGVLADGAVVEPEAKFLFEWLENNRACSGTWPHNFLYERIARILADGRITDEEEKELLDTIAKVAGVPTDEPASEPLESSGMSTAGLPYDDPAPRIEYDGRSFCVTGQFVYGKRSEVELIITRRQTRERSVSQDSLPPGRLGRLARVDALHARPQDREGDAASR